MSGCISKAISINVLKETSVPLCLLKCDSNSQFADEETCLTQPFKRGNLVLVITMMDLEGIVLISGMTKAQKYMISFMCDILKS